MANVDYSPNVLVTIICQWSKRLWKDLLVLASAAGLSNTPLEIIAESIPFEEPNGPKIHPTTLSKLPDSMEG